MKDVLLIGFLAATLLSLAVEIVAYRRRTCGLRRTSALVPSGIAAAASVVVPLAYLLSMDDALKSVVALLAIAVSILNITITVVVIIWGTRHSGYRKSPHWAQNIILDLALKPSESPAASRSTTTEVAVLRIRDVSSALAFAFPALLAFAPFWEHLRRSEEISSSLPNSAEGLSNSIVGLMLAKQGESQSKAYGLLVVTVLLYMLAVAIWNVPVDPWLILMPSIGLFLLLAKQRITLYRIRHGYYGRNEYESREILQFIVEHSNPEDFTKDGGTAIKDIIPEVFDEMRELRPEGIPGMEGAQT